MLSSSSSFSPYSGVGLSIPTPQGQPGTDAKAGRGCKIHSKSLAKYFCYNHRALVCALCKLSPQHRNCSITHVSSVSSQEIMECLSKSMQDLSDRISNIKAIPMDALDKKQSQFEKEVQQMREEIECAVREIRDAVDKRERELLESVERLVEENSLCDRVAELQCTDKTTALLESGCALEESGTEADIEQAIGLSDEITELVGNIDKVTTEVTELLYKNTPIKFFFDGDKLCRALSTFGAIRTTKAATIPKISVDGTFLDRVQISWDSSSLPTDKPSLIRMKNMQSGVQTVVCKGYSDGCVVEDLEPDTEYVFCFQADESIPWCDWRNGTTVKIQPFPPPAHFSGKGISRNEVSLSWSATEDALVYHVEMKNPQDGGFAEIYCGEDTQLVTGGLAPGNEYAFRVKVEYKRGRCGVWSEEIRVKTLSMNDFFWNECPRYVEEGLRYSVDPVNPTVVTKTGSSGYCTAIGGIPLFETDQISWYITILKSINNNGNGIYIGIAPQGINQNYENNFKGCGWYFDCCSSTLCSGPPHNYSWRSYGPKIGAGKYVRTGDSVGVVMNMVKGELSFVVNGVNYGTAYRGIPLDEPLVPCVLMLFNDDSIQFNCSVVEESLPDPGVPVPVNLEAKSESWNALTLTWEGSLSGGTSFYQIKTAESTALETTTAAKFRKDKLLPDTEYSFTVRLVRGNKVGEWSAPFSGRTQGPPGFARCEWEDCPEYVEAKLKYSHVGTNRRSAVRLSDYHGLTTVIGSAPVPLNKVTSWNVKILRSRKNDGNLIFVGVAPFDIDLNYMENHLRCGWYLHCHDSTLCSGPPHSHAWRAYGVRKERGKYVHTGGTIGVVMDTTKGELSFILNGDNYGVAYEGIPLDKPLVPCAILKNKDDSVELGALQGQSKGFFSKLFM